MVWYYSERIASFPSSHLCLRLVKWCAAMEPSLVLWTVNTKCDRIVFVHHQRITDLRVVNVIFIMTVDRVFKTEPHHPGAGDTTPDDVVVRKITYVELFHWSYAFLYFTVLPTRLRPEPTECYSYFLACAFTCLPHGSLSAHTARLFGLDAM